MSDKCSFPLPNSGMIRGAWKELKHKIHSAINTLKTKHNEIIAPGPCATSAPTSNALSTAVAYSAQPTASRISSDTSSTSKGSPQNVSFKEEEEETQAAKSQRLLEYVLKNIKTHDRVSGIKISVERRFNEIH